VSTLTLAEHQSDILASLRRLKGRGTVGDVVAATGLSGDAVRAGLKALLESHRGHLEVSDSGELLYQFDPSLIERGTEPWLARFKRGATRFLTRAFKAWIVITLVVYFVIFVVLVIAALVAGQRGGDSREGGWGGGRGGRHGGGGGHFPIPNLWLWYWIWGPRWHIGRPYYGHRWERTLPKDDKVPFYKKVFAFVFGPDRPEITDQQRDRATLRLIRARNGVITTAELVQHNALSLPDAEQEMARLLGAYDGEAAVSPKGELVYVFPGLMTSAHGRVRPKSPEPAWQRLEREQELTGNTAGANAAVVGINAFNLLVGATAPWFLFPRLGIGGPAAFVGLVLVPVVFSVLFFTVPLLRMAGVKLENRRRAARNVRRVLLGLVYRRSLEGAGSVTLDEAHAHVASLLKDRAVSRATVEAEVHKLSAEFEGEVSVDADGTMRFSFPAIRDQFTASETVRRKLRLEAKTPGEIVFSTADSSVEASERDQSLFDRELAQSDLDLGRYLPSAERIDFEEDYELAAFDEELRRRA
jgi:hypothetical protein